MTLQGKSTFCSRPCESFALGIPCVPHALSHESLATLHLTLLCAVRLHRVTVFYLLHFFLDVIVLFSK